MSNKTIGILGCGWLGYPLALRLVEQGYKVRGTTRSKEKLERLRASGIQAFEIDLQERKLLGDVKSFLEGLDVIIIDIPPGLRRQPESDFAYRIKLFMRFVQVYEIPKTIFVSSTSVFQDELEVPDYDESSTPNATTDNGKKIFEAEAVVAEMAADYSIVRPAGLIGKDRHPVTFLAGKKNLSHPEAPVNLVERDHVIAIIWHIISQQSAPSIIHAVSEPHQQKAAYYQKAAQERNLVPPEYDWEAPVKGKKIHSKYKLV